MDNPTQIRPYQGTYLHGINLADFYPCWNLSLSGKLVSAEFAELRDWNLAAQDHSVRNASLTNLKTPQFGFGSVTPRAAHYVVCAAIIRAGGHLGPGLQNTRWLPREDMDRISRISDVEIAFEETRRSLTPDAASRLCCLWVADETADGRTHIRAMLGNEIYVIRVSIPAQVRVTKTDSRWFDAYFQHPQRDYIKKYWQSEPFNNTAAAWEYLVEGTIAAVDPAEISHIQQHGAHRHLMRQPPTHS